MGININQTYLVRYVTVMATLEDGYTKTEFRVYPDGSVYHYVVVDNGFPPVMMIADENDFSPSELEAVRGVGLSILLAYC